MSDRSVAIRVSDVLQQSDLWSLACTVTAFCGMALVTAGATIECFHSAHLCTGEFIRANACFGKQQAERFDNIAFLPVVGDVGPSVYTSCIFARLSTLFRLVTAQGTFDLALVRAYAPVGTDRRLGRRYLSFDTSVPADIVPLDAIVGQAHLVADPVHPLHFYAMAPTTMRLYSPQRRTGSSDGTRGWNLPR